MARQEILVIKKELALPSPIHKQPSHRLLHRWLSRFGTFWLHHWTTALTLVLGLIVLTAILIPFLSYFGLDVIAKPLFFAMHAICAQISSHSFYILGHQLGLCQRNLSIYG